MKFVFNEPALVLGKSLIVADVHVGVEFELQKKGVHLQSRHVETAKKINELLKETKCDKLFILGDAKHDFYGAKDQEIRILTGFFNAIKAKTVVIKGNHDSEIEKIKNVEVVRPTGLLLSHEGKKFLLTHGQATLKREEFELADWVLMGHFHPMIEVTEGEGFVWREKSWIVGDFLNEAEKKFVVFPAFNDLSGGMAFNKIQRFGPIFSEYPFDRKKTQAILLSGVKIGSLQELSKN